MAGVLLLQVHCTTIDKRYTSYKEELKIFCEQIVKDSRFKKGEISKSNSLYNNCLYDNFKVREKQSSWSKGYLTGSFLAIALFAVFGAWLN